MEASASPHRRAPLRSTSLPSCSFRWVFPPQPQPPGFLLSGGEGRRAWEGSGQGEEEILPCPWQTWVGPVLCQQSPQQPAAETWSQGDRGEASEGRACRCPGQDPRGPSSMVRFLIQLPTPFSFLPSTVSACHSWHCQLSGHMCLGLFSTSGLWSWALASW